MGRVVLIATLLLSANAFADSTRAGRCELWTSYTLTKDCGPGVYAGPNKAEQHGGVCLFSSGDCAIVTKYTLTKNCGPGWVYAGPNRPDLHGGTCMRVTGGYRLYTSYIQDLSKDCGIGMYVGPNRPDIHGGYCVYLRR